MTNQNVDPPSGSSSVDEGSGRARRAKRVATVCGGLILAGGLAVGFATQRHFEDEKVAFGSFALQADKHGAGASAISRVVHVKNQLAVADVARVRDLGYVGIIDMRPDGEDEGQASSAQMSRAAKSAKIPFAYVPVPHGEIPDTAVVEFRRQYIQLPRGEEPVLIYCRSGRRAARTWALAAAAYESAPIEDIKKAVKEAGQDASDLDARMRRMRLDKASWSEKLEQARGRAGGAAGSLGSALE